MVHTQIAFESVEEVTSQMIGVPTGNRFPQALTEHMDGGLGNERHTHMTIADIEVEGACPVPSEGLVGIEKLFTVPSFWVLLDGRLDGGMFGGAKEGLESVVSG